jgi:hypothetical protein
LYPTAFIQEAYIQGISTRSVDELVKAMGTAVSAFSAVRRGSRKPAKYEPLRSLGTRSRIPLRR